MNDFKGKAIFPPLNDGPEWNRFNVQLTPEFEDLRVKAIELLQPYAQDELDNVSSSLRYFKIDDEEDSEHDVCNNEECINKMYNELKEENPDSEIEIEYSANDSDHESLQICSVCCRYLNTQLTWVEYEVDNFLDNKNEWNKETFISGAFELYCILENLPSNDHNPSKWAIRQYENGNTLHIDLRTKFYEKIMELIDAIHIHLSIKK